MRVNEIITEDSTNEGSVGAGIGAGIGALAGGPLGAAAGAAIGNWVGNKISGGPKAKAQTLRQQAQSLMNMAAQYDSLGNFQMPNFTGTRANSPMQDERFISSIQNIKGPDIEKIRTLLSAQAGIKEAEYKPASFSQNAASLAGQLSGAGTKLRQTFQAARGAVLTPQEIQRSILQLSQGEAQQLLKFFNGIHPSAPVAGAQGTTPQAGTTPPGNAAPAAGSSAPSLGAANPLAAPVSAATPQVVSAPKAPAVANFGQGGYGNIKMNVPTANVPSAPTLPKPSPSPQTFGSRGIPGLGEGYHSKFLGRDL